MVHDLLAVFVASLALETQRVRVFRMGTFLLTIRSILDVLASVAMVCALVRARVGALLVA